MYSTYKSRENFEDCFEFEAFSALNRDSLYIDLYIAVNIAQLWETLNIYFRRTIQLQMFDFIQHLWKARSQI